MINITDIFKNNISSNKEINNSLPFIIINPQNINETRLLVKIPNTSDFDIIYKLNYSYIYQLLKSNNIDPENFAPLGDMWFNKSPTIANVLLINTRISIKPMDYIKIDNYCNLSIWKPIGPTGYTAIGFIASSIKPSNNIVRLVPNIFLTPYNNNNIITEGRNINMNEYNLLATINEKYFTINKSMFVKKTCKIENNDNETSDGSSSDDSNINKCDVWSIKNANGITLLEDDEPWYVNKKSEHEKLSKTDTHLSDDFIENINNTESIDDPKDNGDKSVVNFNFIACSLLFLISIMIGFRYFWK